MKLRGDDDNDHDDYDVIIRLTSQHYRRLNRKENEYSNDGSPRIHHSRRRRRSANSSSATTMMMTLAMLPIIIVVLLGHEDRSTSLFVSSTMLLRPRPQPRVPSTTSTGCFVPSLVIPRTNTFVTTSTSPPLDSFYGHHHQHQRSSRCNKGVKLYGETHDPSAAGRYLNRLSSEDGSANSTTLNDVFDDVEKVVAEVEEEIVEYDDDDYANSVLPVRSTEPEQDTSDAYDDAEGTDGNVKPVASGSNELKTATPIFDSVDKGGTMINDDEGEDIHPNEEPPIPVEGDEQSDASTTWATIYEDTVKSSKFDSLEETSESAAPAAPSTTDSVSESSSESDDTTPGIITLFQQLMGGPSDADKSEEESERARKWGEWMASGRKVRETDASDVALDESLLSVDKGADYVVVAVPAEAADGIGPILSSFPGGKMFQKTVEKTYQEVIGNRDGVSNSNNDTSSTSSTATISIEKKKKKEKKKKEKKKKSTTTINDKKNKQKKNHEMELKQKRLQQRHYREQRMQEPGQISANDWRHNIHNMGRSTILRDVRNPVACVFAWATLWSLVHNALNKLVYAGVPVVAGNNKARWLNNAGVWFASHMNLPTVQHTMMVSAMSFLLVFRTNSAYQRFAEGRKIWNDIVDTTRDFSRMIKLYEFAIGTSKCRRINSLLASFPYLLRHRIRPSLMTFYRVNDLNIERDPEHSLLLYPDESLRDTDPEVAALVYDEEETGSSRRKTRELCWVDRRTLPWKLIPGSALELCARAQNRPLWVCDRMAKELAVVEDMTPTPTNVAFTNRERLTLIGYVDKLSRSIGGCERIHQTVVPLNYARHALRSLTVWLWTLPFVLVKDLGLLTGPVVAILSWILFGVYEIGTRIEDPFQGTLRLSIYCDAIRRDVLADAIARDTAFDLDEEGNKSSKDENDDYDAIFELDSESEEYDGDDNVSSIKKKGLLGNWGFKSL